MMLSIVAYPPSNQDFASAEIPESSSTKYNEEDLQRIVKLQSLIRALPKRDPVLPSDLKPYFAHPSFAKKGETRKKLLAKYLCLAMFEMQSKGDNLGKSIKLKRGKNPCQINSKTEKFTPKESYFIEWHKNGSFELTTRKSKAGSGYYKIHWQALTIICSSGQGILKEDIISFPNHKTKAPKQNILIGYDFRKTWYQHISEQGGKITAPPRMLLPPVQNHHIFGNPKEENKEKITVWFKENWINENLENIIETKEVPLQMDKSSKTYPFTLHDFLRICMDVAKTLKIIHDLGYVHSDFKFANVLVNAAMEGFLTDFDNTDKIGPYPCEEMSHWDKCARYCFYRTSFEDHSISEMGFVTPFTDCFGFGLHFFMALFPKYKNIIKKEGSEFFNENHFEFILSEKIRELTPQSPQLNIQIEFYRKALEMIRRIFEADQVFFEFVDNNSNNLFYSDLEKSEEEKHFRDSIEGKYYSMCQIQKDLEELQSILSETSQPIFF